MVQQVHLLVGSISSGKSTYAHNAAKEGFIVVNDDSIVEAVHAKDYTLYDKTCKPIYKAVQLSIFTHALSIGKSVVIDVGNRSRHVRERWASLARGYDVPTCSIWFKRESPEIHARRRADSDGRGHSYEQWLKVAQHHDREFEGITESECAKYKAIVDVEWDKVKSGYVYKLGE